MQIIFESLLFLNNRIQLSAILSIHTLYFGGKYGFQQWMFTILLIYLGAYKLKFISKWTFSAVHDRSNNTWRVVFIIHKCLNIVLPKNVNVDLKTHFFERSLIKLVLLWFYSTNNNCISYCILVEKDGCTRVTNNT